MFQTSIAGSLPKPAWLVETQKWALIKAQAAGAALARQRYGVCGGAL